MKFDMLNYLEKYKGVLKLMNEKIYLEVIFLNLCCINVNVNYINFVSKLFVGLTKWNY